MQPITPHLSEEIWSAFGMSSSILMKKWPKPCAKFITSTEIIYPIQVNGKRKTDVKVSNEIKANELEALVLELPQIKKILGRSSPRKIIIVPGRIVNVVV